MSARSLTQVTNTTQADTAAKTSLLKHSGVKPVEVEPKHKPEEWAKKNSGQKSHFKQDFSRIPVSVALTPMVQLKLVVGRPDDRYEQEADRIAEQVMRMPEPTTIPSQGKSGPAQPLSIQRLKADTSKKLQRQVQESEELDEEEAVQAKLLPSLAIQPLNSLPGERLQRQADELHEAQAEDQEEEEPVQAKFLSPLPIQPWNVSSEEQLQRQADELQEAKPEDEEEEPVQTKGLPHRIPSVTSDLASRLKASRGGGQPLPASTREFMESRFNHDFSQVRVHTDGQANQLARKLNAQAFTFKQDIYFGAGYYQLQTSTGKRLLAHELTHTIQQQPRSLLKPRSPFQLQPPNHQSEALPESESGGAVQAAMDSKPKTVLPIAQTVSADQGIISRRVAPPSAARPVPVPDDKTEADPELEGPFAPPSAKTAESAPTAPVSKEAPKAEEEADETLEQGAAEAAEAETALTGDSAAGVTGAETPTSPDQDPAFQGVVKRAKGVAKQQKHHASAKAESGKAQAASEPPKNEVESKAQDRQVQELDQQKPGTFNADAFVTALLKKIAEITPDTEEKAQEFKKNNKIDSVKKDVSSQVSDEKGKTTDPIAKKNEEAPNTSGIEPKPVKPLEKPDVGPQPPDLNAAQAAPKPKPEAEVSEPFKKNSEELDQQMSGANVTEEQLAKSNEPEFTGALDAKKSAQTDAAAAPDAYRKDEQGVLTNAQTQAQATEQAQTKAMFGERGQLLAKVQDQQKGTKDKDEQERTGVANHINGIYEGAKKDVEEKLKALDDEVNKRFDAGAQVAKQQYENYVGKEMDAYKEKRYGAWYSVSGLGKRVKDAFAGLPPEVNEIFVLGRAEYIKLMQATLKNIANYVADTLNQAKQRIADGKKEIQTYVAGLKPSLQKVGQEAADKIQEKFDQLEEQVNSKQDDLIDSLVEKYQENLKAIDEDIKKRQDENKGWIDQAKDKVKGVIETIRKLREMLENTLARIKEVAQLIINDPIGFLKNLVDGLKQGFQNFVGNIGKHLQAGLVDWLIGTLGPMGIEIPEDVFSLKGIFSLVTQVLGLTWPFIREKAVKLLGEPVVAALEKGAEKGAEIFQILAKEGPIGLWNHVKEQFTDLKETVMDQIKNMIISQVIQAGMKFILGLLNPVAAFVKAAIAIYDIVMFFVERAAQIREFIYSIVDAVQAIARGQISGAAKLVELALVKSTPLIIGLLAAVASVGGLAKKVQAFFMKVRKKVDKAINGVILKIKRSKAFKAISKKVKGWVKKGKAAVKKAKNKAKALIKKAKKKAKAFVKKVKKKVKAFVGKVKKKLGIGKGKDKKKEKDKKKAEKKHVKIGKAVVKALSKESAKEMAYDELRKQKEQQAKELEVKYNKQLEQPVKLKVTFKPPPEDKEDNDLDFHIHIGPNSVDLNGAAKVAIPKTVVTYKMDGNKASSVTADPLTRKEGDTKGSRAGQIDLEGWSTHIETIHDYAKYYVRLHVLSAKLHGPGNEKWNLTPGKKPENTLMEQQFETPAFKLIKKGKALKYESKLTYRKETGYESFAEKIDISYEYKDDQGKLVKKAGPSVPITKPDPKGSKVAPTLNTMSSRYAERRLEYVSGGAMKRIIDNRPIGGYANWTKFKINPTVQQELKNDPSLIDNLKKNIPDDLAEF